MIWPLSKLKRFTATDLPLDAMIRRLEQMFALTSGVNVSPENCMESPTVQAIVTAISRRVSVSPVWVYQTAYDGNGRQSKERLPGHPVSKLLQQPNSWQARQTFFLDAASVLVRWGRFYALMGRGQTGPIRKLWPMHPSAVVPEQSSTDLDDVRYRVTTSTNQSVYPADEVLHARGAARDFLTGDSPVTDVREAIGLEIAYERFGAAFFGNGAFPTSFFSPDQGFKDFKDDAEKTAFLDSVRNAVGRNNAHSLFWLPKGIKHTPLQFEAEKQQMTESRKYQRTVIAGAFGVPPHLVGDLERGTFNNVEQQDTDFVVNVVLPVAQQFEAAMEQKLLTAADRAQGRVVRFNLDVVQRADFKSRQEGLQIQRQNGVINANEWREAENRNPITEAAGGEDYIVPANMQDAAQIGDVQAAAPPGGGTGGSDAADGTDGATQ